MEIVRLNDRLNLYNTDEDPDKIHLVKSPDQFEADKGGTTMDFVVYCGNYFKNNFPDIPFNGYFLSFWNKSLHYYSLPLFIFKAQPEDYLPVCYCNLVSSQKSKKGPLRFGVYTNYCTPEQAISHEIFQIMSNPPDNNENIKVCTAYCYRFDPTDKALIGMSEPSVIEYMKTRPSVGILPGKDFPVGAPVRSKSARRADEINKIFRYNKYDLTARAMEVLEGDKTSQDYDSFWRDKVAGQGMSNQMNGADAAKV